MRLTRYLISKILPLLRFQDFRCVFFFFGVIFFFFFFFFWNENWFTSYPSASSMREHGNGNHPNWRPALIRLDCWNLRFTKTDLCRIHSIFFQTSTNCLTKDFKIKYLLLNEILTTTVLIYPQRFFDGANLFFHLATYSLLHLRDLSP